MIILPSDPTATVRTPWRDARVLLRSRVGKLQKKDLVRLLLGQPVPLLLLRLLGRQHIVCLHHVLVVLVDVALRAVRDRLQLGLVNCAPVADGEGVAFDGLDWTLW